MYDYLARPGLGQGFTGWTGEKKNNIMPARHRSRSGEAGG